MVAVEDFYAELSAGRSAERSDHGAFLCSVVVPTGDAGNADLVCERSFDHQVSDDATARTVTPARLVGRRVERHPRAITKETT